MRTKTLAAACLVVVGSAALVWKSRRKAPVFESPEVAGVVDLAKWDPDVAMRFLNGKLEPSEPGLTPEQVWALETRKSGKALQIVNMPKAYDEQLLKAATTPGPDGLSPAGRSVAQMPSDEREELRAHMKAWREKAAKAVK